MIINNVKNKIKFKEKKNILTNTNISLEVFKKHNNNASNPLLYSNNIMDEIQMMRRKEKENSVQFLKIYNQTEAEYQEALAKIHKFRETINENHIASIVSINKITSTHRRVLELFSYLIDGDLLFNWEKFRSELNIFEVKFKMSQIFRGEKINFQILCNILNKTTKDKNFSKEFLVDKDKGIYLIFKWIREVLKVYFYLEKQKNKSSDENLAIKNEIPKRKNIKKLDMEYVANLEQGKNFVDKRNLKNVDNFSARNISGNGRFYPYFEENFPNEKMIQVGGEIHIEPGDKLFHLTNMNPKISLDSNSKFNSNSYSDSISNLNPDPNLKKSSINPKSSHGVTKNKINIGEIKLGFDTRENNLKKDKKNLLSIPFIKYKNFHELKHYYKLEAVCKNEEVDNKHFDELNKFSLKRPTNRNKLLSLITSKRIDSIEERSVQNLILYDEIFARKKSTLNIN